jgi:Icc protein
MSSHTVQDPVHLVQITDTHLYGKPTGTLLKMNTHDSLTQVMRLLKKNETRIDYILATGDVAQDASPEAYQHFIDRMAELDAPFSWIPGNHDKASVMREVGADSGCNEKLVDINGWRLIFLNSSVEGQVHGKLSASEYAFLKTSLTEVDQDDSVAHCLVCMHHNPTKGNSGWMKDIGLQNGEAFFDLLSSASKLRTVVYGHVHQELDYEHRGIRCLCTPSTCIQFKPFVTNFALDKLSPGYRSLLLHANGEIETQVHRVEGFAFNADFGSDGY